VIGVIPKTDEFGVVEEFFQLFKTPWELYRAGESYDVVLVTGSEIPEVDTRLLLIYGSADRKSDRKLKVTPGARRQNASLEHTDGSFPLYGDLLTFEKNFGRVVCTTSASEVAGIDVGSQSPKVVRMGYDLFEEVAFLLTAGQPVENSHIPTLELHISHLRGLIVNAGISVLEIPPMPADCDFAVCLTHDIDFVGIRRHKFDHTMWGFLYRSTAGVFRDFLKRRVSVARLLQTWKAAASLPFVYLGWIKDFWMPFDWYLKVEKDLSPTYFFIPFKHRRGEKVTAPHAERRASAYDISDISDWVARLQGEGCEVGVHGIDAWHSMEKGREELKRVAAITGRTEMGIRMHWLLSGERTYRVLEQAGYSYDSTSGYNEAPGYRCGTTQAFRPLSARTLLELPMHIQDGALFFPGRLGLTDPEAWERCATFVANAEKFGGVLTLLWHDRSPGPERFWGDFYAKLVQTLKARKVWFGTAGQVVAWFRKRRGVTFERVEVEDGTIRVRLCGSGQPGTPPLRIRIHSADSVRRGVSAANVDLAWNGESDLELHPVMDRHRQDPGKPGLRSRGMKSMAINHSRTVSP
jgi:hypothetical protein